MKRGLAINTVTENLKQGREKAIGLLRRYIAIAEAEPPKYAHLVSEWRKELDNLLTSPSHFEGRLKHDPYPKAWPWLDEMMQRPLILQGKDDPNS